MTVKITGTLTNPDFPYICYNNLVKSATITVSSEATGFEGTNTQNPQTWNYWQPTAVTATIDYTIASTSMNYCGIAAHNMGTNGNTVTIQYSNQDSPETFTTIDTQTPTDDSIILFLFNSVASTKFRVQISGGTVPNIGNIFFGQRLEAERGIYGGHTPITLNQMTTIRPNKSEGGHFLGRSIIRTGASTTVELKNLTAAWVRASFKPFITDAISNPFFFAWHPTTYTAEVAYGWVNEDISVQNNGKAGLMDTSFTIMGILE